MTPLLDHLHVTVRNLKRTERSHGRFLPLPGFDLHYKEHDRKEANAYEITEYHHAAFSIGIVSPRSCFEKERLSCRRPGASHHVAFTVDNVQTVDRLYEQVLQIEIQIVHAPRPYPGYCEDYCVFFLKGSEDIELEITCYDKQKYFPYINGDAENNRHGS